MAEKDSNIVENELDLKFISGLCLRSLTLHEPGWARPVNWGWPRCPITRWVFRLKKVGSVNETNLIVGMKHLLVGSEIESPYKSYPSATVAVWGLPLAGLLVGSCWLHLGMLLDWHRTVILLSRLPLQDQWGWSVAHLMTDQREVLTREAPWLHSEMDSPQGWEVGLMDPAAALEGTEGPGRWT